MRLTTSLSPAARPDGLNSLLLRLGRFLFGRVVMLLLLLFAALPAFSQTNWLGRTSSNWHTAANWSAGIPDATDDVTVQVGTFAPSISAAAVAKSVTVQSGASLTVVATTGTLTINGATFQGLLNEGTVTNNGIITIGNTASVGNYGIYNESAFNNNSGGQIHINNTTLRGISNDGTFTNAGQLLIGAAPVGTGNTGIQNNGTFNNNNSAQIQIDRSTIQAIRNVAPSGFFVNAATITIGANANVDGLGIENDAEFQNNNGGQIQIDRTTNDAIRNTTAASFTNNASIIIGANGGVELGIFNQSLFTNSATGSIQIEETSDNGIQVDPASNFANSGSITIGANETCEQIGIFSLGLFQNNTGGNLQIDRTTLDGIRADEGTFNNAGAITIGSLAQIELNGITSFGTGGNIHNLAGGNIQIFQTAERAIWNSTGTMTNAGTISIDGSRPAMFAAIRVDNLFQNLACGVIEMQDNLFVDASGILENNGLIRLNTADAHINTGTVTNNGIIEYAQNNTIPNVTNNEIIAAPISGGCSISPALSLGTTVDFDIATNWFLDENLTMPAGTFNEATNTFSNTNLTNGVPTTVYFEIEDAVGGCTRVVSIQITSTANLTFYADSDGDGFGNPMVSQTVCTQPGGYVSNDDDCADNDAARFPGNPEICDGKDNNCNLVVDDVVVSCSAGTRTWTGAFSTDWHTACNWNPTCVPTAADDVTIPNVANDPTISAAALAKSVEVQSGAVLTISAASTLTIDGSTTQGITNSGTVQNNGTITIGATASTGNNGITNAATFNNNTGGQINIDRSTLSGIHNLIGGTFTNAATITIGATASVGTDGITNAATFNNNTGGQIKIDRSATNGLLNFSTFTNAATITIGASASVGTNGLRNTGTFNNNTGGQINIDRSTSNGLQNVGTFTNAATITIGAIASVGTYGIRNFGTFNHNTGGQITIDRSVTAGIYTDDDFNCQAIINIGAVASVGSHGILNEATFNNTSGGEINIGRSTLSGLRNETGGTFTNAATITIGANASVGVNGITNGATFNNNTGGEINIDRSTTSGLQNVGTFTNAATLTIGANASVGTYGIQNTNSFNNNACAEISMHSALNNSSAFTNTGYFSVNTALPHTNTGTVTNNGIIEYAQNNTIPNVTNNEIIVAPKSSLCLPALANALELGTPVNFTISGNWFFDQNLSLPAGTYNPVTNTFTASGFVNGVPQTVYFSINDAGSGCARTVSAEILFEDDTTPPTITCPANLTASAASGQCAAVVTYTAPTGTDNCSGASTARTTGMASGSNFPVGTTTNTFVVTAANSQTASCAFTVTVTDNQPPTISCPDDITANATSGQCAAMVAYTAPTGMDNCSGATTDRTTGLVSGSSFPVGITTNTFVVTAANSQTASCAFTVTVSDNQPTTISCPDDITANAASGQCAAVVTYTAPVGTDNCSGASTAQTTGMASGGSFPVGITTNTFVVTAANSQTASCAFTVTVSDNQSPTISCPDDIAKNTDVGQCSAVTAYSVTASDNCAYTLTRTSPANTESGSAFPVGTTNVAWSVTDAGGNATSCAFTVTVTDNAPPTINCPTNIAKNTDAGQCSAVATYSVTASDNCTYTLTRTSPANTASGSAFPVGTTNVEWSVTDAGGNATSCAFTVTVTDNAPPTINCPTNIAKNTDAGQCSAVTTYTVTASDNCAYTLTRTSPAGTASGSQFPLGTTNVTWSVSDAGGNVTSCAFTVTVTDNAPPTINCPTNIAKNTDAGQCSAVTTYTVTASDNCAYTLTRISPAGTASGSQFPLGTTNVAWSVSDAGGNATSCAFTVTVTDAQLPSIICPSNIVRSTDAGQCSAVVTYATPSYSDNCAGGGVAIVPPSLPSGSAFPKGLTMVNWKATDAAGNTAICQFTVTVNDAQLPSIACPSNQTVGTTPTLCTGVATFATPTGSDNCPLLPSAVIQTTGLPSGSAFPKGQTTVTFKVTDAAGLTKTCTFRVTVNDTEAPAITCPAVAPITTTANSCSSAPVTYTTPTATDNCPGTITVLRIAGPASGSSFYLGTTNVTWRAIDGAGRSSTCSFAVVVTDATLPSVICPQSVSVTGSGSPCTASVAYATPTATDNCGLQSSFLLSGQPSGSSFPLGATNITWRAVDNGGNSATCSFTVTVGCGASPDPSEGGANVTAERDIVFSPLRGGWEGLLLSISPNPATKEVQISVENLSSAGGELTVVDAQGRLMLRQHFGSETFRGASAFLLDLDDRWQSGVYFVTLRSEGQMVTKRLVVSRL